MNNNPFISRWEGNPDPLKMSEADQKIFIAGALFYRIKKMIGEEIPLADLPIYLEGFTRWREMYPQYAIVLDLVTLQVTAALHQVTTPPAFAIAFLNSVYDEVHQMVNGPGER